MIKNALVFIALFLGLFLMNCSDNSSNDPESSSSSSLQVTPSSPSQGGIAESALKAQPVAASDNPSEPNILGSWTDGQKNYYVIDAGVIRNTFISAIFGPEHYDGFHPVQVTRKDITTSTVTISTTETVSKSIAISNTLGVKVGLEEAIKAAIPGIGDISAKLNLEVSKIVNVSDGRTTTTSVNNIETYIQSIETSREITFGINGAPAGYYRYALYGVSDVYFVIETSLDNQTLLSWDVISCVRPGDYLRHNDYSSDGNFDNSPSIESQIVFTEGFYKTLPKPPQLPKIEKTETKEFTSSGTFTFNKAFPATIEVYALGGGGGGQGGHYWVLGDGKIIGGESGTGGFGGGGGATYMELVVEEPVTFGITVGKGGNGGSGENNSLPTHWYAGSSGGNGESTIVTLEGKSITLIANGGTGGGYNRTGPGSDNSAGGPGGSASTRPISSLVTNWDSKPGNSGSNGTDWGCVTGGKGGNAASLSIGSASFVGGSGGNSGCNGSSYSGSNGSGGGGGYNDKNSGGNGGNGRVKIIVTYYE